MMWIGLYRRSYKHASSDGHNSVCGLIRFPQNDGEIVMGNKVSERQLCQHCALRIPALLRRQRHDTEKRN
jgi:hypothetical protein